MNRKRPVKKTVKKTTFTRKEAEAVIKKQAQKVTPKDLEKVLDKTEVIREKFENAGPLGKFIGDFKLLIAVVKDYWKGNYKKIPFWSIAAIVAALLYVLNPFDIIPDFIPVIGYIDDAAVIAACLAMVRQDLHNYRNWKLAPTTIE
jgi:uncharacterized membrane protein YkvA (DUF1232 family)